MSIVFNLAISREHFIFRKRVVNSFLFSELAAGGSSCTLMFQGEFKTDYVRVYH